MKIDFLPLHSITESFEPELSEAVQRVIRKGRYLNGSEVNHFEDEFASYLGVSNVVGVGNGLDALTLSLLALKDKYELPEDSEVILPNMTFIATAEAVVRAGLTPVMVDVSNSHGVMTPETILPGLSLRTRVLIPVHLFGYPAPMREICQLAKKYNLLILEDAAQAHGAELEGRKIGAWGNIAAFSFYPGKNLGALGDAGAVVTDDDDLAHRVKVLANYGAEKKYYHSKLGINSRLDEIQAAILRIKLRRLDKDNEARKHVAKCYSKALLNNHVKIPFGGDYTKSVFHLYPIRTVYRDQLQVFLAEAGIETLIHYPLTISSQEAIKYCSNMLCFFTPNAHAWAKEELSIPINPILKETEICQIIDKINEFEKFIK